MSDIEEEGRANGQLGNMCHNIGDAKKAVDWHKRYLKEAQEMGDTVKEGKANACLGKYYNCLGKYEKALDHHERHLRIAKDTGDRSGEGRANCGLGVVYYNIGDFRKAIDHHEIYLNITREVRDKTGEGLAYGYLGNAYQSIGNFKKAIQCQEHSVRIATEVGDRVGECSAYCGLGNAYGSIDDLKKAFDYFERCLDISTETGDKHEEASAYGGIGNVYGNIGNFKKAIEYHERELRLAKQIGHQAREGRANGSLGEAYCRLRDFKKAIYYQERYLDISRRMGDKTGEGRAYSFLGNCYHHLGDFHKAIESHERSLKIFREQGYMEGIANGCGNLGLAYLCLGDSERAKGYYERHLKIAQEVGDKVGEANTYYGLGCSFELLGSLDNSHDCYQSSVKILNDIRNTNQFKDEWKISLRHMYQDAYTKLWLLLLKQEKISEALFAAEQGRAQALKDLMELNYGLLTSSVEVSSLEEIIHGTFSCCPSVFTAVHGGEITFWVVKKGNDVNLKKKKITEDGGSPDGVAAYLQSLIQNVRDAIGVRAGVKCEDRSLEELGERNATNTMCDQTKSHSLDHREHSLKMLYDVALSPIIDLVDGDELVIIPEGPLCLAPYAAFVDSNSKHLCESFRIRMIPSLTTLRLINDCPAGYHCKRGALLVGDPWVQNVVSPEGGKLQQLPCAREEVEMIGRILNNAPLTGTEATKTEVLKRLTSVALVHIAAHGRMETGEIALSPDPSLSHQIPEEEDYLLTMADVLNVKLRARLVVLSCCHSGRGDIKAEGVVGIARAFLGAGSRSVLVSLWAIDDEATLEFMKYFYQNLAEGRSASEALNRAMNFMRKSNKFCEVRFWAPFVLIGDDVTLEFGGNQ